jgi:hypothetical protein
MLKYKINNSIDSGIAALTLALLVIMAAGCISHLKTAKSFYLDAERFSARYQTEHATAAYKRARQAAGREADARPSAQAYMIKGMAEMKLRLWMEAQTSFQAAFALGFAKGEEWARELALFGVASSFRNLGLQQSAAQIHAYLMERSRVDEVRRLAAQAYADYALRNARTMPEKEQRRNLEKLLKDIERLSEDDLACGYYHYVKSQVLSHLGYYRDSLEEAVMARELGLPGEKIFRDNDNQIVFCYRELKRGMEPGAWKRFESMYKRWIEKWKWPGPETPVWTER